MDSTRNETNRGGRTAAWICLACAFALLFFEHWRTLSDPGLWTRLAAGQAVAGGGLSSANTLSFAVPVSSRATVGWLYNYLLFAAFSAGGAPLATILHLALFALALVVAVRIARCEAGWLSIGLVAVAGLFVIRTCQVVNPAVLAIVLAITAARLLQRKRMSLSLSILLGCLQVVWANSAPGALLLPILVAASLWQTKPGLAADRIARLRLAVATLLLPILNPAGPGWYAMEAGFWLSPSVWTDMAAPPLLQHLVPASRIDIVLTLLLLAGLAGMLTRKDRLPPVETTLGLAAALLATRHQAHGIFLPVWALPFLALSLDSIADRLSRRWPALSSARAAPILAGLLPTLAVALTVLTALDFTSGHWYRRHGWTSRFGAGLDLGACPAGAAPALKTDDFPARTWNLPRDGGFLAFTNPGRKIFCDTRSALYGRAFLQSVGHYLAHDPATVETVEQRWNIEAVLLNALAAGSCDKARRMLESGDWTLGYWDGVSILLLKPRPYGRQEDRISPALRQEGLRRIEDEANRWATVSEQEAARLPFPARLAGAADFLFLTNRHAEAGRLYRILLRSFPELAGLRFMLGHCLMRDGRTLEAVREWEWLVRDLPRHRGGWLALQAAYQALGRGREAGEAAEKAKKLAPKG